MSDPKDTRQIEINDGSLSVPDGSLQPGQVLQGRYRVLGIIGMFQPWIFSAYKYGFLLLLFSTLAFILWSHVTPAATSQEEELGAMSISDFEQRQSHT